MSPAAATKRAQGSQRRPSVGSRRGALGIILGGSGRKRGPEIVAALLIVVALMSVIVGHAVLTQGQMRLGRLDAALTAERSRHSQTVLKVAELETPSRISSEASSLQLVQPKVVLQLPMVSLEQPLPQIQIVGQQAQGSGR